MIQTKQISSFVFTCPVGETTFNFQIQAESQSIAAQKLIEMLAKVIDELKPMIKTGAN